MYSYFCDPVPKCQLNTMIILAVTSPQIILRHYKELNLTHLSGTAFLGFRRTMAQLEAFALEGPCQNGRGGREQYVYWVAMAYPTPKTLAQKPDSRPPKGLTPFGVVSEIEALGHFTTKVTSIPMPINNHPPKVPQTYKKPLL